MCIWGRKLSTNLITPGPLCYPLVAGQTYRQFARLLYGPVECAADSLVGVPL